jgi:hypothetical protein
VVIAQSGALVPALFVILAGLLLGPFVAAGIVHAAVAHALLRPGPGERWNHDRRAVVEKHEHAAIASLPVLAITGSISGYVIYVS